MESTLWFHLNARCSLMKNCNKYNQIWVCVLELSNIFVHRKTFRNGREKVEGVTKIHNFRQGPNFHDPTNSLNLLEIGDCSYLAQLQGVYAALPTDVAFGKGILGLLNIGLTAVQYREKPDKLLSVRL